MYSFFYVQANNNLVENYPVYVNPEGPLYSKAVGIKFKVCICVAIHLFYNSKKTQESYN